MVVSPRQTWQWNSLALVLAFGFFSAVTLVNGRIGFEKLTEYEYRGNTYYTIRNLSLYECQGWCREEPECQAAVFSFVVNPVTPIQETVCRLQNETQAVNPSAVPTRAVARYNMIKLHIRTDNVCKRPWTFERVPNHMIAGLDNARVFTSTKEACLAACLNEKRFVCRSAEYNYESLQCLLSQHDRRAVDERVEFVEAQGVDYFENLCLKSENSCRGDKEYNIYKPAADKNSRLPQILPTQVAQYVDLHYYVDKELMTSNLEACKKACIIEEEFLCRSFMYKGPPQGTTYNCQLFHLDHNTYPDGDETYRNLDRPLMDDGERIGNYYENECINTGPDAAYSSQYTSGPNSSGVLGGPAGTVGVGAGAGAGAGAAGGITAGYPAGPAGQQTGTVGIETGGAGGGAAGGSPAGLPATSKDPSTDVNCDSSGICYDVAVHCKDTRIVVEVNTNKPFNGRIYAMGRSETCNVNVIKSPRFRLDLTMSGQDCNTKSSTGGVYSNTVVIQHHNKVMTKTDKIYKVRCTYDTSSKNITFGMMPVGDPDMISITSAPEAPPPRIRILDANSREVETVKIGDRLTFRIDIPQDTPYGIFARSCVAMAKDARSTFQLIDDRGCPVDPSIFPRFLPDGLALVAYYDAFRFTESYGVIFQCNVRYCLGPCEPATCEWGSENYSSYGKRKRRSPGLTEVPQLLGPVSADRQGRSVKEATNEEDMTLSQELFVLDFGDDELQLQKQTNPEEASEGASGPRGDLSIGFGRSSGQSATGRENIAVFEVCPTRTSVLALAVTCALLLLIYICSLFYFLMRRWYVQKPMQ